MSDKPQDSAGTLRAFVEEVELRHKRDAMHQRHCTWCNLPWPCDAARGAAVLRRVDEFVEIALDASARANNAPVHDAMMTLSAWIGTALEGK